ncbi:GCN5-related N-acetyltransferase [Gloeothece citriformis PCC 7424]|uniref:GCN5-related N-acetyltransferase n=1 Tax=Gloeothece citriformis (strain PCC 7424) TaxID=65393 RepID=B7KFU1_GLOC7|nr:GNAT family N-acetyltransferase [Gloeothece citriformis]ACK69134.1 GCN5-related N-acetyltransferase [Gloeothece citriformis PCC 7424]
MKILLRQAKDDELNFLDALYTENMKESVERVYPWNPNLFRQNFVAADYQVIEIEKVIIGFIKVVREEKEIYLGEIQVRRVYQNQGIGTQLINSLKEEAQDSGKNIRLRVLQKNSAYNLYKKLGFEVVEESQTHKIMKWIPPSI